MPSFMAAWLLAAWFDEGLMVPHRIRQVTIRGTARATPAAALVLGGLLLLIGP
jgi:hypothetical protein